MKKLTIAITLLIVIAAAITVPQFIQKDTTQIGGILMMTGDAASWGENSLKGAQLAVDELNSQGANLEIIIEDDQGGSSKAAVNALYKLMTQDSRIILGTNFSPPGLATAPIACNNDVLMISPSLGVNEFNEECDTIFNLWPHDDVLSSALGEYIHSKGYNNVVVLGSNQVWEETQARAVTRGFENAGGTIAAMLLPDNQDRELRVETTKISSLSPDAVVFTNYDNMQIAAVKLRQNGVKADFFTVLIDKDRILSANGAFENTIVITSFTPSSEFATKFTTKYNAQPDIGSDTSYDAIMLIAESMAATGSTDPVVLSAWINKLTIWEGASGILTFDGLGGVNKPPQFKVVRDDQLVSFK